MAKPFLITNPVITVFDNSGIIVPSGAKIFVYQAGTTTKINTYPTQADAIAGTNANANPIIANSAGRVGAAWSTQACKVVVCPSNDTDPPSSPYYTTDNITSLAQTVTSVTKTANYTVTVSNRDMLIKADASGGSFTISLLSAVTAGDGFNIKIQKIDSTTNSVIVACNGAETWNGSNTVTLYRQRDYIEGYSDGTQWIQTTNYGSNLNPSLTKTANYTVTVNDKGSIIQADATAGNITISLPTAASAGDGFGIKVQKIDSSTNTVTVDPNGAETWNGNANVILYKQRDFVEGYSDSSRWIQTDNFNKPLVPVLSKTSNYTVTLGDKDSLIKADATSGNITITLPAVATTSAGFSIKVQKVDSSTNTVTVACNGAETWNGSNTIILYNQRNFVEGYSDTTQWIQGNNFAVISNNYQRFLGPEFLFARSVGTWTMTRAAQADYSYNKSAAAETPVLAFDITEVINSNASRGFRLTKFDYVYSIGTSNLNSHSVTLDKVTYINNSANLVTAVPVTGTLATATQANPYVTAVTVTTPAFNNTTDSKYIIEVTANCAAGTVYKVYGVNLYFSQVLS